MNSVGKIVKIVSFALFVSNILFLNYLGDIARSVLGSISRSFNIAVAIDSRTPVEVISDRIEALDGVGSVKIKSSAEIFEEYKKDPPFNTRAPVDENIFNNYILVYPDSIRSVKFIEELAAAIRNTAGVEEISYDKNAVEIYIFIKKLVRYINCALIVVVSVCILLWAAAFFIVKNKKAPSAKLQLSSVAAYGYYLIVTGAAVLAGASALYRNSGLVFNWFASGLAVFAAALLSSVIFQLYED